MNNVCKHSPDRSPFRFSANNIGLLFGKTEICKKCGEQIKLRIGLRILAIVLTVLGLAVVISLGLADINGSLPYREFKSVNAFWIIPLYSLSAFLFAFSIPFVAIWGRWEEVE